MLPEHLKKRELPPRLSSGYRLVINQRHARDMEIRRPAGREPNRKGSSAKKKSATNLLISRIEKTKKKCQCNPNRTYIHQKFKIKHNLITRIQKSLNPTKSTLISDIPLK